MAKSGICLQKEVQENSDGEYTKNYLSALYDDSLVMNYAESFKWIQLATSWPSTKSDYFQILTSQNQKNQDSTKEISGTCERCW